MIEIKANEIINLVLYLGVFMVVLVNFRRLKRIPAFGLLMGALVTLLSGALLTVAEGMFPSQSTGYTWLNFVEHCVYAGFAVLLALWCRCLPASGGASA